MKIAIYCPLGPLDRFGYQYNNKITVESYCSLADRVYLVSTSRSSYGFDNLRGISDKVVLISDEQTWFKLDEQGQEVFDPWKPCRPNANIAISRARSDGMDCIINLHINQYIPAHAVKTIKQDCQHMLDTKSPYTWLYRRYQLVDRLFHTDVRLPWILNLQIPNSFEFDIDSIKNEQTGEYIPMESGNFHFWNGSAIVDSGMELQIEDLVHVRKYTRNYMDLRPDATDTYDWDEYRFFYTEKFKAKSISNDSLDAIGIKIFRNSPDEFVSHVVLQEYLKAKRFPGKLKKVLEKIFRADDRKIGGSKTL